MMETKQFGGMITEVKQHDRNGVPVGILSGYGATWDIDRGDYFYKDQFVKGAFLKSISDHKKRNNRQIRLKDGHGRTVGGIPINTVKEDSTGLYVEAEVNLEVEQGREMHSLARQGVIVEFSIGFSPVVSERDEEKKIRSISEAIIWEISPVDEPMNIAAEITEVKSTDKMLEIVDIDFNPDEAKSRIDSVDGKERAYIGAFLIADEVDGEIKAVKDAIFSAAGLVQKLSKNEKEAYIVEFNKYYAKMNISSPFSEKSIISVEDARIMTPREFERVLKETGRFSNKAAKVFASGLTQEDKPNYSNLLSDIKKLTGKIG